MSEKEIAEENKKKEEQTKKIQSVKTIDQWEETKIPVLLGKDEYGKFHLVDLCQTGNIIIGGATGSGKSVFNHNLINSAILKHDPSNLRFFLADPKKVEFSIYENSPYILGKAYIMPEDIFNQLSSLKKEILNKKYEYLIIVIDTFSDLMVYYSDKFESVISDLSKLNSKGVYMVICDSRTGPNVFSPKIMSCFPTKIAFQTCDEEGSRLLIGCAGAENLLGKGDMLFLQKGEVNPIRLQAPYI